jgi:hypothetical protein
MQIGCRMVVILFFIKCSSFPMFLILPLAERCCECRTDSQAAFCTDKGEAYDLLKEKSYLRYT